MTPMLERPIAYIRLEEYRDQVQWLALAFLGPLNAFTEHCFFDFPSNPFQEGSLHLISSKERQ